jgi:hypothetical protein
MKRSKATANARRLRARRTRRPVQVTVMRVVIPETGELVGALVPDHPVDRRTLRERGYGVGTQLRAELAHARNVKFFRLAHALGGFLADHVEGYAGLGQHDALKRLQERSGIGCTVETFTLDDGQQVRRSVAESLNFTDMDEGRWQELWDGGAQAGHNGGWTGWLRTHVFGDLEAITREEIEHLIERPETAP